MNNQDLLQKHLKAKEEMEVEILNIPGVHGISVGYKTTGGEMTDTISIVVHVYRKITLKNLPPSNDVVKIITSRDNTLVVDVIECMPPQEETLVKVKEQINVSADTKRYDPLKGGCKIQVEDETSYYSGTGGCIAQSKTSQVSILTNYHVIQKSQDNKVYQPSVAIDNLIGSVGNTAYSTEVDGAEVKLNSSRKSEAKIIQIGSVKGTKAPELNDLVQKYGATTGLTNGKITNIAYSGQISGGRIFTNQIIISKVNSSEPPLSAGGDSGSAWVLISGTLIVALHWGGDGIGDAAYASPIGEVEKQLGVTVSTE